LEHKLTKKDFLNIIQTSNNYVLEKFIESYKAEIDRFADEIYKAYQSYKEIDSECKGDERKAYIAAFLFNSINSLIESFNLLICGHWISSGNIMRHFIESSLMAILLSRDDLDKNYYEMFKDKGVNFKVVKAFDYVEKNLETLDLNKENWEKLREIKKQYNLYSHASALALCGIFDFSTHSIVIGCNFDQDKKEGYEKEIKLRISAAQSLISTIEFLKT
jgi:hypothetical protein